MYADDKITMDYDSDACSDSDDSQSDKTADLPLPTVSSFILEKVFVLSFGYLVLLLLSFTIFFVLFLDNRIRAPPQRPTTGRTKATPQLSKLGR